MYLILNENEQLSYIVSLRQHLSNINDFPYNCRRLLISTKGGGLLETQSSKGYGVEDKESNRSKIRWKMNPTVIIMYYKCTSMLIVKGNSLFYPSYLFKFHVHLRWYQSRLLLLGHNYLKSIALCCVVKCCQLSDSLNGKKELPLRLG